MKRFGECEFSSFSSGSKVRARREMPTSGPGGVSAGEGLFRWSPFPAEKVVVFAPAAFEDATDGKEKNHASAVCRVSRSLAHLSSTVLDPRRCLRSICCSFFSRLSHDKVWRYKLCSAVVFEAYVLFLRLLSCICRASAVGAAPNPPRCKNEGNGRSFVVAPVLCIQLVSANQYVRKTTKQRACKTVRQ